MLPRIAGDPGTTSSSARPSSALRAVVERRYGTAVKVAAQNMHEEDSGAFTGEVSAPMLVEVGVEAVVLGHSERRQLFGETDEALARKVPAALAAGLEPILCVGESEEARDAGADRGGARAPAAGRPRRRSRPTDLAGVVIAYEPIWAIGTGRTATPEQAQEAIAFIRDVLRARGGAADRVADPLRRLGQAGQRRRAAGRSPTSTAPWSAAPASIPRTSPRSSTAAG